MWKTLRSLSAIITLVSTATAGLLGAVVMMAVGPWLAMGLQMYTGNTEPTRPHLAYPAVAWFVCLMLPVPWIRQRRWSVAAIAAIPLAVLPYVQLWRLYGAAG